MNIFQYQGRMGSPSCLQQIILPSDICGAPFLRQGLARPCNCLSTKCRNVLLLPAISLGKLTARPPFHFAVTEGWSAGVIFTSTDIPNLKGVG